MLSRALLVAAALTAGTVPAAAQVNIRPEPAPVTMAGETDWYRAGEPVMYRGELFYPGGPQTFFDKNIMVLVGEFRGVSLYADPTVETNSVVFVPVAGTLMQPYEKLRAGDLAGTSGSSTPSYPPATPTALETEPQAVGTTGTRLPPPPLGDSAAPAVSGAKDAPAAVEMIAPERATRGTGIWIEWNGTAWNAAGPAVKIGAQLTRIGAYEGRAVFKGPGGDNMIWIETAQGMATPWKREIESR